MDVEVEHILATTLGCDAAEDGQSGPPSASPSAPSLTCTITDTS
ncbi:hypothetical protein [Embleya sp. NPDC005971]